MPRRDVFQKSVRKIPDKCVGAAARAAVPGELPNLKKRTSRTRIREVRKDEARTLARAAYGVEPVQLPRPVQRS